MFEVKHICMVLGGALFGSAGIKLLSSKDAKKAYTHVTAAVMRCADSVMETATTFKENCGDIKADAKEINEIKGNRGCKGCYSRGRGKNRRT